VKRVASALLALLALTVIAATAGAAPKTFLVDRSHSEVGFNVRHYFTKVHGRFNDYSATIVYDAEKLEASSVEVTIRDSSIYTANDRRDAHLRSDEFFWQEKYPNITFKSTKVVPGSDAKHFQVQGDLTVRDVTKPVTLDVEVLGVAPVAMDGKPAGTRAGFEATTTVNRKDFGIVWNRALDAGGFVLADEVEIVLSLSLLNRDDVPTAQAQSPAPPTAGATKDAKTGKTTKTGTDK
jgi:polyisoprenoid-binding protein YceI